MDFCVKTVGREAPSVFYLKKWQQFFFHIPVELGVDKVENSWKERNEQRFASLSEGKIAGMLCQWGLLAGEIFICARVNSHDFHIMGTVINPIVKFNIPIIRIPCSRWDDHPHKEFRPWHICYFLQMNGATTNLSVNSSQRHLRPFYAILVG